jgi:predicted XRE-type DNA-binding protein
MQIGRRFGRLVVLENTKNRKCLCKCDCGTILPIAVTSLYGGQTLSCKCLRKKSDEEYLISAKERFFDKLIIGKECWIWIGLKNKQGYGNFNYRGKYYLSHRMSWIFHNGLIPQKYCVCHKCDNPSCVNPEHLFLGTHSDNMNDAYQKGRRNNAKENHPRYRITKEMVEKVKDLRKTGLTQKKIGEAIGLTQTTVSSILLGKHWLSS